MNPKVSVAREGDVPLSPPNVNSGEVEPGAESRGCYQGLRNQGGERREERGGTREEGQGLGEREHRLRCEESGRALSSSRASSVLTSCLCQSH